MQWQWSTSHDSSAPPPRNMTTLLKVKKAKNTVTCVTVPPCSHSVFEFPLHHQTSLIYINWYQFTAIIKYSCQLWFFVEPCINFHEVMSKQWRIPVYQKSSVLEWDTTWQRYVNSPYRAHYYEKPDSIRPPCLLFTFAATTSHAFLRILVVFANVAIFDA